MSSQIWIIVISVLICAASATQYGTPSDVRNDIDYKEFVKMISDVDAISNTLQEWKNTHNNITDANCVAYQIETRQTVENATKHFDENIIEFKQDNRQIIFKLDELLKRMYNACDPNPCFYGGRCELTSCGRDYKCVDCPKHTSGKCCETIDCNKEDNCWLVNKTIYMALPVKVSWSVAKEMCEKEGMTLAMPKTKEINEFLANALKPVFGNTQFSAFWFGITRNETGTFWIDGSHYVDLRIVKYALASSQIFEVTHGIFNANANLDALWTWSSDNYESGALCEKHLLTH